MNPADTGRLLGLATKVLTQKAVERAHGGWIPEKQRIQQQRQAVKAQEKQKKEDEKRSKLQTGGDAEDESGRMPPHTDIGGDIITQKLSQPTTFLRGMDLEANVPQFATGVPQLTPPQAGGAPTIKHPLEEEAAKTKSFDEFKKGFLQDIKHGRYFHVTNDPNFNISSETGPRDMSSIAGGKVSQKNALMITSDPRYWVESYGKDRPYIAEIDVSKMPYKDLKQVNRGMGNEFFIPNASEFLSVKSVKPVSQALKEYERYRKTLPNSEKELLSIWEKAQGKSNGGNVTHISQHLATEETHNRGNAQNLKNGGRVYPLADRDQWKLHHLEKDDSKLVHMEPDEFLGKAQKLEDTKENKKDIKHWKKKIKKGDKLGPAALYTDGSQDGRHRVEAAKKMGIKKVPVLTWPERGTEPAKEYVKSATKIARKASKK